MKHEEALSRYKAADPSPFLKADAQLSFDAAMARAVVVAIPPEHWPGLIEAGWRPHTVAGGISTILPPLMDDGPHSRPTLPALLLACLLFHSGTASAAPAASKAPRVKPLSAITVKVWPADKMEGKLYRITAVDQDSCTAWVSSSAPNLEQAELAAFKACRQAVNKEVDAAAERAGV